MKKFILATLVLASSTAFAQIPPPAPGAAPSPKDMALAIGRTMGTLPVMQEACGHTAKQKTEFKAGVKRMTTQLAARQGGEFEADYDTGSRQGESMMRSQLSQVDPVKLAGLCKQFNEKFPDMLSKLNTVDVNAQK